MTIFKAYDIRGVYPKEINEEIAYKIGRAFVDYFGCKTVVIGRDMRKSSPSLFEALSKGITKQGADVIDIGMTATPMLSFAVMKWNIDTGIMITASHNPGKYNAFKLIKNEKDIAIQIHENSGIKNIEKIVEKNNFRDTEKKGIITKKDISKEYKKHILSFFKDISELKVVIDYGNGVGSISSDAVLKELPIETIELFKEPDGDFPNHEPNPHDTKNLKSLQKKVIEKNADLGIFFDGDADRSIIVDERGKIIFPDIILGILSIDELEKTPYKKIFYDLRFTKSVPQEIKNHRGIPEMLRVGNPFYKEALLKNDGILGGEFSGHIMYKKHFGIDDGLFSALNLMGIMHKKNMKISEIAKPFYKYFKTEEINMKVENADYVFENVKNQFKDGKLLTLDGILISFNDWWFSLRKSNTEPLVRLMLEADTKELMEKKRDELVSLIKNPTAEQLGMMYPD